MPETFDNFLSQQIWAPDVETGAHGLIRKFGKEAVFNALKRLSKARRGRTPEPDADDLNNIFREDALLLIDRKNPFELKSNRSIAIKISKERPGQSAESTKRRIMVKLQKERRSNAYLFAVIFSRENGYGQFLRALKAAFRNTSNAAKAVMKHEIDDCERDIKRYTELFEKKPERKMSLLDIRQLNKQAERKQMTVPVSKPQGLFSKSLETR